VYARCIEWIVAVADAATTKSELKTLIGNTSALRQLEPEAFTDAVFGVPTVTDILQELEKPGRRL
jgi:uncharacterized protein